MPASSELQGRWLVPLKAFRRRREGFSSGDQRSGHPGIFDDHRESGSLFNVSSEGRCFDSIVSPSLYWGVRTHSDHRLLLDIQDSFVATYNQELKSSVAGSQSCSPNTTWDIPEYRRSWPHGVPSRKRRRRRGKRGGVAVKLKMTLHAGRASSFVSMTMWNLGVGRCAGWRLLDPAVRWLRTILQDSHSTIPCYPPIRVRRGGANLQNLRSLNRVFSPAISDSNSSGGILD
ncbi:hypothetical protein PO909_012929 [Leuciscus waleckii]